MHRLRLVLKRAYLWGRGAVSLLIGLAVAVAVIAVVVALGRDLMSDAIRIDALQVPKPVADAGLSPEVAARRLRDSMNDIVVAASTPGKNPSLQLAGDVPNIVVPTVGITFSDLSEFLRNAIGLNRHVVGGEITGTPANAALRLRIDGRVIYEVSGADLDRDDIWHGAAEAILRQYAPYIVAFAMLETNPSAAVEQADQIIATLPANDDNVSWAYLLRGINKLDEGLPDRAMADIEMSLKTSHTPSAPAHTWLGRSLVEEGRWAEAAAELRVASHLDPTDASIDHYLAVTLWAQGDFAGARERFAICNKKLRNDMQREPDNAIFMRSFANSLVMQGRVQEALVLALRAVEHAPRSAGTLIAAVEIEEEAGMRNAAAKDARDAATRLSQSSNDVLVQAASYIAQDSGRREAIGMLDRVIDADPDYALAYQLRGQVLNGLGRTPEAAADFGHALALNPYMLVSLIEEAKLRIEAHDLEGADARFARACSLDIFRYDCLFQWSHAIAGADAKHADALRDDAFGNLAAIRTVFNDAERYALVAEWQHYQYGMAQPALPQPPPLPEYQSARCETLMPTDRNAARPYCERAVRLAPHEPFYREQLARLLGMGQTDDARGQAIAVLMQSLSVTGPHASTRIALAQQLDDLHEWQSARMEWSEALRLDPDDGWAQNQYGVELDHAGLLKEAALHYRIARALRPNDATIAENFVETLCQTGEGEEDDAPVRDALVQWPNDRPIAVSAAICFNKAGMWSELRTLLNAWIAAHPDDMDMRFARGLVSYNHRLFELALEDFEAAKPSFPDNKMLERRLEAARRAVRQTAPAASGSTPPSATPNAAPDPAEAAQ